MANKDIRDEIREFELQVNKYEQSLRTKFISDSKQKHIQIQQVNNETLLLKNKINELVSKKLSTVNNYKISSLSNRASDLIRKYETVKDKGLTLNGDILFLYGQIGVRVKNTLNN